MNGDKSLNNKIKTELLNQGTEFVYFVDISSLSEEQNRGYPNAVLFGMTLSPDYLQKISRDSEYVKKMIQNNQQHRDEFNQTEKKTDSMADNLASYLKERGYDAFSQSEKNLNSAGLYNQEMKRTILPHKTVAGLAGLGFIGKHDLLVTPQYGSAVSMCTVLTDAPLKTEIHAPAEPQCRDCRICVDICSDRALMGNTWHVNTARENLVDVYQCTTCLKCLVFCPWTQKYMKNQLRQQKTGIEPGFFRDSSEAVE